VPSDRTLVLERFHDELGDWRVVLHSPYGLPVHSLGHDLLELLRVEEEQLGPRRLVVGGRQSQDDAVIGGLRGAVQTLPRRDPGRRTPLWQQRQRSAQLLDVARKHPQFPIVLETVRECLQDVYDLPALQERQQQRAGRALAEAGGEQRRGADSLGHDLLELLRVLRAARARAVGPGRRGAARGALGSGQLRAGLR
jgi:ATP-dependent Lhr-like helicase